MLIVCVHHRPPDNKFGLSEFWALTYGAIFELKMPKIWSGNIRLGPQYSCLDTLPFSISKLGLAQGLRIPPQKLNGRVFMGGGLWTIASQMILAQKLLEDDFVDSMSALFSS